MALSVLSFQDAMEQVFRIHNEDVFRFQKEKNQLHNDHQSQISALTAQISQLQRFPFLLHSASL